VNTQTGEWFYLLASGDLYQFTGDENSTSPLSLQGNLIANVGADAYVDPTLLHEAISQSSAIDLQFTTGATPTFTITPDVNASGTYVATVTASDGTNVDAQSFVIVVS
jgi:hypothetical protein